MNYSNLRSQILAAIKYPPKISAASLQEQLINIVNGLDLGALLLGVATPSLTPNTEANGFYFALQSGTYTNFPTINGQTITVDSSEVAIIVRSGNYWSKIHITTYPTIDPTTKHWMIGNEDTGVLAEGTTPHIDNETGNWFTGTHNTGVHAQGAPGKNGQDAINPFKGWWPDFATLKAAITATEGDSAYVKDAAPATTWNIYVYDSTASSDNYWVDSGLDADTSNVQTFASGEEVNEVHIVNDFTTGGTTDVLSAEQGKQLNEKLYNHYDDSIVSETDYYDPYMSSETLGTYFMGGAFEKDGNDKYYWLGQSVGNARTNYIPQSVLGTIKETYHKLRVIGGPNSTNYAALVMFAKKALPTSTNLTFQQMVEGGYICDGFTEDNYIISISTSGNLPNGKEIVIPSDANYFYAVRKSADDKKRGPSSVVPFSAVVEGDVDRMQQEISELQQQGISDGAVTTSKIADSAVTKDKLADGAVNESLVGEVEEYESFNLLDFDNLEWGKYLNDSGKLVLIPGGSDSYRVSNLIPLHGKKIYYGNLCMLQYGSNKGTCLYDANGGFIRAFSAGGSGSYDPTVNPNDNAAFIRFTLAGYTNTGGSLNYVVYANEDGSNPIVVKGLATNDIDDYFRHQVIRKSNQTFIESKENVPELIPAYSSVGQNGFSRTADSINQYALVGSTAYPSYLKCNHTISFKAFLDDTLSGTDYIRFGLNRNSTSGKVLDITPTQAIIKRYDGTYGYIENISFNHNLTIKDFIMCEITFTWYGGKFRIISSGGSFVKEWQNSQYSYTINAQINYGRAFVEQSITLTNAKLTQSSDRFMKPVWVIGDSYTSMNEMRWTYQLVNNFGIDGFLLDGYAGAPSTAMVPELKNLLKYGTPKYLVWCLGLNDRSDLWKYCFIEVEALCRERGITLICQTLPYRTDTLVGEQEIINSYILSSGYRYIDGFNALCKNDGTWYDGMKYDGAHPTVLGAKVLAGQVLIDFPEIANYK